MAYVLDANVLLQAFKKDYPMDVAEGFWQQLGIAAQRGDFLSIDRVKDELYTNPDDLSDWCDRELPDNFFRPSVDSTAEYQQVINWAFGRLQYMSRATAEFTRTSNADAWLAAYGLKHQLCVVTMEASRPDSKKIIKLPDVCLAHTVDWCSTMEMFRRLELKF